MSGKELHLLREKALDYGIKLSDKQLVLFRIYLDELENWNQHINLTGLSSLRKVVLELLLDSLIPAPFLPQSGMALDVGSGAGFPGLPLKIHSPQLRMHLLEPNSKKVNFLKQVIRLLKLEGVEVIKGRIEKDRACLCPEGYPLITTRALARPNIALAWCAPLLCPGGLLVSFLGSRAEEEREECQQVMERNKLFPYKTIPYLLPGKKAKRTIFICIKE